jgi:diguanylate cyclase (GGDEF)-like protein
MQNHVQQIVKPILPSGAAPKTPVKAVSSDFEAMISALDVKTENQSAPNAYDRSHEFHETAVATGDPYLIGAACLRIGRSLIFRGDYEESLQWHEHALKRFVGSGHEVEQARCLSGISTACVTLGWIERALDASLQAADLISIHDCPAVESSVLNSLGMAFMRSGGFADAIETFRQAREAWLKSGQSDNYVAFVNGCYAEMLDLRWWEHHHEGPRDLQGVQGVIDAVMEVLPSIRHYNKAAALITIALGHRHLGRHEEALAFLSQAEGLSIDEGFSGLRGPISTEMADALLEKGDIERALRVANDSFGRAGVEGNLEEMDILRVRARIYHAMGRVDLAFDDMDLLSQRQRIAIFKRGDSQANMTRSRLAMQRELGRLAVVEGKNKSLSAEKKVLEKMAYIDPLTGLKNRRFLAERLPRLIKDALASKTDLAILFMDLDSFKAINDSFSHQVGDEVLKAVADVLRACSRGNDHPIRLAGDEFVLVLPGSNLQVASRISERVKTGLAAYAWSVIATGLNCTASVGVVAVQANDTPSTLLHRGDMSMYQMKDKRRSRTGTTPVTESQ